MRKARRDRKPTQQKQPPPASTATTLSPAGWPPADLHVSHDAFLPVERREPKAAALSPNADLLGIETAQPPAGEGVGDPADKGGLAAAGVPRDQEHVTFTRPHVHFAASRSSPASTAWP